MFKKIYNCVAVLSSLKQHKGKGDIFGVKFRQKQNGKFQWEKRKHGRGAFIHGECMLHCCSWLISGSWFDCLLKGGVHTNRLLFFKKLW